MDIDRVILDIVSRATHPKGWYAIARSLTNRGIVLEANQSLATILESLVQEGLLEHQDAPGHPSGIYVITPAGQAFLADDS